MWNKMPVHISVPQHKQWFSPLSSKGSADAGGISSTKTVQYPQKQRYPFGQHERQPVNVGVAVAAIVVG